MFSPICHVFVWNTETMNLNSFMLMVHYRQDNAKNIVTKIQTLIVNRSCTQVVSSQAKCSLWCQRNLQELALKFSRNTQLLVSFFESKQKTTPVTMKLWVKFLSLHLILPHAVANSLKLWDAHLLSAPKVSNKASSLLHRPLKAVFD